jgi:excinuclease ABC subunit C
VCAGKIPQKEYLKNVRHIVLFLEGKKKNLIKVLNKEMKEYVKELNFEKCSEIQKTLHSLEHIQDVSMIKKESSKNSIRIEAYDIAHMSGKNMVGVMVVLNNGEFDKNEYRKFNIQTVDGPNDTKALREVLERRFSHTEWAIPNLVVVDGGIAQLNAAKEILPKEVGLVSIVKDSRHKAREILTSNNFEANNLKSDIVKINAEAHRFAITFHRKKRGKMPV